MWCSPYSTYRSLAHTVITQNTHTYIRTHTHTHTCMCACTQVFREFAHSEDIGVDISERDVVDHPNGLKYELCGESCIPGRRCIHVHIKTHTHTHTHTHAHTHTHTYTHTLHTHTIHTHTHTHTHTLIYTHKLPQHIRHACCWTWRLLCLPLVLMA